MNRLVKVWAVPLLALGFACAATRAEAQSGETSRTAAETLFIEAKKLMEAGRFAEACPKFADSQRLDPGVGTLLNLALCYEKQGKVASAWSKYREAAAAARSAGQAEREGMARQRASALEVRLSRLTVTMPPSLAGGDGVELRLDGVTIPPSLWGVAAPVDPGDHTVEVTAKGKKPWSAHVQVMPPANPVVQVPELENGPPEAKGAAAVEAPRELPPKSSQRTIALVIGGVGVVAVGVGTVFGLSANSTYHGADPYCNQNSVCTEEGFDQRRDAYDKATLSTIAFGVGGVALASSVILWLSSPKVKDRADAPKVALAAGPSSLAVRGAW
jgi:serine/threonine-protein kinase